MQAENMSSVQRRGPVVKCDESAPRIDDPVPRIGGKFASREVVHALYRVEYGDRRSLLSGARFVEPLKGLYHTHRAPR